MKKHVNIAIFIPHLGCPFSCIYCNQKTIAAQEHVPDADEVQAIIEQCLPTIPAGVVPELAFFGGNFTTIDFSRQKAYLEAVRPYLDRGLVQGIRISTRPDGISAAILTYLQDYGVETIELGVQSLNDEVLRASARGYSAADVFKSARLIQDYGFQLGLQFMVGLPGMIGRRIYLPPRKPFVYNRRWYAYIPPWFSGILFWSRCGVRGAIQP